MQIRRSWQSPDVGASRCGTRTLQALAYGGLGRCGGILRWRVHWDGGSARSKARMKTRWSLPGGRPVLGVADTSTCAAVLTSNEVVCFLRCTGARWLAWASANWL